MRLISQDGNFDIPYEETSLIMIELACIESDGFNWENYYSIKAFDGVAYREMGTYRFLHQAQKEMNFAHERYYEGAKLYRFTPGLLQYRKLMDAMSRVDAEMEGAAQWTIS